MDTPIEKLDVHNIIEVQRMRTLLVKHPDLLTLLDELMVIINNKLNTESVES